MPHIFEAAGNSDIFFILKTEILLHDWAGKMLQALWLGDKFLRCGDLPGEPA